MPPAPGIRHRRRRSVGSDSPIQLTDMECWWSLSPLLPIEGQAIVAPHRTRTGQLVASVETTCRFWHPSRDVLKRESELASHQEGRHDPVPGNEIGCDETFVLAAFAGRVPPFDNHRVE